MVRSHGHVLRGVTAGMAVALVLAACNGGQPNGSNGGAGGSQKAGTAGGTIFV